MSALYLGRLVTMARTVRCKADRGWRPSVGRYHPLTVIMLLIAALYLALLSSLGLVGEPADERYLMAASYGMVISLTLSVNSSSRPTAAPPAYAST